jgi:hypothetical protein
MRRAEVWNVRVARRARRPRSVVGAPSMASVAEEFRLVVSERLLLRDAGEE